MKPTGLAYAGLWLFALTFGWVEASVVVYLRELYALESGQGSAQLPALLQVSLVVLPERLLVVELVREACTLLMLASVGWLAGRGWADRIGAFLVAFGIWDLVYYAVLWLVTGWPSSIATWDVLFLIPIPWVAPVWAPAVVAALFVAIGSYLFWTPARARRVAWPHVAGLGVSVAIILAAFVAESRAVLDHTLPERFPAGLFWLGVATGVGVFILGERRGRTVFASHH